MANRFSEKAFYKCLLLFLFFGNVDAQNITRKYVTSNNAYGGIYHIFPQKGYKNIEGRGKFIYDITLLSYKDTATINFSIYHKDVLRIDSICYNIENKIQCFQANKLYINTKKDKWHYRYSINIVKKDIEKIYGSAKVPALINIKTGDKDLVFQIKSKKWERIASINRKILTIISYNN